MTEKHGYDQLPEGDAVGSTVFFANCEVNCTACKLTMTQDHWNGQHAMNEGLAQLSIKHICMWHQQLAVQVLSNPLVGECKELINVR